MNILAVRKTIPSLMFCCCLLSTLPAQAADQEAAWQKHTILLQHHAQIVRYYIFKQMSAAKPIVNSQAGERASLKYEGREPIRLGEGPWPGTRAIELDANCVQGKPFAVGDRGFTVEIRFRKRGQGSQLGNGHRNGMLIADGTGYWDGFRISSNQPDGQLRFEIGRPKPKNAFGVTASDAVPDDVWHHLAATWNGREMRIYLNGTLLQAAPFTGHYTPSQRLLKIGYADSGIGSLKLDVCEVAIFNTALSPTELMQHACLSTGPTGTAEQAVRKATEAIVRGDWKEAAGHWKSLASDKSTADTIRTVAKLAWARALQRQGDTSQAIQIYADIADDQRASDTTRRMALRMCVPPPGPNGLVPIASRRIYERLITLEELAPAQRRWTRVCLAQRCMQDGDPATARRQYELILKSPDLNARQQWNIRLQIANSWLAAKDYKTARAAYTQLARNSDATSAMRAIASLAIAHSFAREHQYAAAAAAFHSVANQDGAPKHLRQEASDREKEMKRLESGQVARDPSANRMTPPALPHPAITCYVAPDGNDDNPGTIKRPFANLAAARDAIRNFRSKRPLPPGGVAVVVRGGTYHVAETLQLNEDDSGTTDAPIVYQAYPGEHPRLVGGILLRDFHPVADPKVRNRLPAEVRDHVLQIDLKNAGVTDFGSLATRGYGRSGYPTDPWVDLYVDGQPMQLARWPNDRWLKIGKVYQGRFRQKDADKPGQFEYSGDRPGHWNQVNDIWMFGAWGRLWEGQYVKVAKIDPSQRLVSTRDRTHYGFHEGYPYYFLNILEELDSPGEWFLDRATGTVYLYPPNGRSQAWFPTLSEPFVTMQNVSHVQLRGLAFEYGRAEGVVVKGGQHVLLAGCTLCRLGTNGVIVQGGTNHGLLGCDIHLVGAGGVRMAGGDFKSLTPGRHFVENCHIHHFSRVDRVYAPAVHLDGVGNRISHNLMHHSPHHAMRLEGFEHIVEFNEVHSVVYEYDDQAGLDIYGSPIYRGNIFRYNFWHHIGSGYNVAGQAGIRLDDFISDILIYGNVFYRCAGGHFGAVQIHGGKNNVVDNNLFIDCKAALSFSPWGERRWRDRLAEPRTQATMKRYGIDVTSPPFSTRYPDLLHLQDNPDRNFVWRNLIVDCPQRSMRDRGANQWVDNHAMMGDPGFLDRSTRDFSLPDKSVIYDQFDFRPIPFQEIGLYKDSNRASWPVTHDVSGQFVAESKQ